MSATRSDSSQGSHKNWAGGRVLPGLLKRRADEKALFLTGFRSEE